MLVVTMPALERAGSEFIDETRGRPDARGITAKGTFKGRHESQKYRK